MQIKISTGTGTGLNVRKDALQIVLTLADSTAINAEIYFERNK